MFFRHYKMVWVLFWDDFEVNVNVCIHDFDDAKEESNKAATFASRLIQNCFNKQSLVSRFLQDQALSQNKGFQSHPRLW